MNASINIQIFYMLSEDDCQVSENVVVGVITRWGRALLDLWNNFLIAASQNERTSYYTYCLSHEPKKSQKKKE